MPQLALALAATSWIQPRQAGSGCVPLRQAGSSRGWSTAATGWHWSRDGKAACCRHWRATSDANVPPSAPYLSILLCGLSKAALGVTRRRIA
jgi:hypothetical protein